jgi:tetratricopeptide (TPR) repeat protein
MLLPISPRELIWRKTAKWKKALEAYRQVLNVDPGQIELAVRVAALLTRDDDYPGAIDVLKDVIKVHPKASEPYLELAFIYAKYLKQARSGDRVRQQGHRFGSATN